jgi:hypothetical protein
MPGGRRGAIPSSATRTTVTTEECSAEMKRRAVVRTANAEAKARQEVRAHRNNRRKA